jgi:hypothetical protein
MWLAILTLSHAFRGQCFSIPFYQFRTWTPKSVGQNGAVNVLMTWGLGSGYLDGLLLHQFGYPYEAITRGIGCDSTQAASKPCQEFEMPGKGCLPFPSTFTMPVGKLSIYWPAFRCISGDRVMTIRSRSRPPKTEQEA